MDQIQFTVTETSNIIKLKKELGEEKDKATEKEAK